VKPGSKTLQPVICVMSVTATLNQTAETQYENMQADFNNIVSSYDATPLKVHTNSELEDTDMQKRWVGSKGDHAADQKKHHGIVNVRNVEAIKMDLGSCSLLAQGPGALIAILEAKNAQKISDAVEPVIHIPTGGMRCGYDEKTYCSPWEGSTSCHART